MTIAKALPHHGWLYLGVGRLLATRPTESVVTLDLDLLTGHAVTTSSNLCRRMSKASQSVPFVVGIVW
jgi:hypothetical protein